MNSPAYLVAQHLAAQGFGAWASEIGWSINVGSEPDLPDTTITLYDTQGIEPDTDQLDRRPSFQIRARGPSYLDVYGKLDAIATYLMSLSAVILDGTRFCSFEMQSDILGLGKDDNNRHVMTVNMRVPNAAPA